MVHRDTHYELNDLRGRAFYENGGDATRTVLQRGSTGAIVILCSHIKCFSVFKIIFKILRVILRLVLQQIEYDARLLALLN